MSPGEGRRILVLAPFPPGEDAPHGGGRLIARFVGALAARNRVALLTLRGDGEHSVCEALRDRCEIVEEIPRSARPPAIARVARRLRLARDLARGIPQWPSDWGSPAYRARAERLAREWRPDVIQIEFHLMTQHAPPRVACAAPRVLTEHEPGVLAARERVRLSRGLARWDAVLQAQAWERFERRALAAVETVVVFTERDRAELAALGTPTPIAVIPPGSAVPPRPLDPAGVHPPRLCFVGSFAHPPNVDAATWLATDILPRIRARHPEVVLDLVGADPPPDVRRLACSDVVVSGTVPDVTPYLDRAAVVVAPLRLGGGMRVKVLETLAAGKALVASRLAVEGLQVADGEHVLLAETAADFARQIDRLLADPPTRIALAARARAWAEARQGWDRCLASYEALYDTLTRPREPALPPAVPAS